MKPPEGVPEKRFLSITFLEEDPYIMLNSPTTCTGATKGTICQIVPDWDLEGVNITEEVTNPNSTKFKCCSGFCVDLIRKFSADLSFDFALKRVKVSCDWWILTILVSDWWIPTILVSDWSRTGRGAAS